MRKLWGVWGMFALVLMTTVDRDVQAQIRRVGPGSTFQGDVLRGEGVFLQGMSWYELRGAKAEALNTKTAMAIAAWDKQVYDAYMQDRNAHLTQRKYATEKLRQEAAKKQAEKEERLRTNPSLDEVQSGEALNALLVDLSKPSIGSSMHYREVELPPEFSLKSLMFRFAPKPGAKGSQQLSKGVIALSLLDRERGWPDTLKDAGLAQERRVYEDAYRKVRDQSLAGQIELGAVLAMDRAIDNLGAKVNQVIPTERNYRSKATQFVRDMKAATAMFNAETMDFAREMIADTQAHEAHSVEELLAFMRKYRLLFASAINDPDAGEKYGRLYSLLRQQKERLAGNEAPVPDSDRLAPPRAAEAIPVPDRLTLAHADLVKLNFGRNADRAPRKKRAAQLVAEASRAAREGKLTREPLEEALKEIGFLRNETKMSPENRQLLKSAADRITAVLATVKAT